MKRKKIFLKLTLRSISDSIKEFVVSRIRIKAIHYYYMYLEIVENKKSLKLSAVYQETVI